MAATIPILTQEQVGQAPQPRPVFASGDAPVIENQGAQAQAGATEKLGSGLDQFSAAVARAKEEGDQAEVMARIADLGEYKTKEVDGKALRTTGRAAIGVMDRTLGDYDSATKALSQTLTDRYQQKLFQQHVDQDRVLVQHQLKMHEVTQLEAQQQVDFDSGIDRIASDAGLRWKLGSVVVDQAIGEGTGAIKARAAARGWSDEQTQQALRNWRSRVVASFVNNASSDPAAQGGEAARAVLARFVDPKALTVDEKGQTVPDTRGLIDADVVKQLWHTVREAGIRDTARKAVDSIIAALPPDKLSGVVPLDQQIALARKVVKNSDALPEVESQLRQLYEVQNSTRSQNDKALAQSMILGLDDDAAALRTLVVNKADPRWTKMTDEGRTIVMTHFLALQGTERRERDQALQLARYDFFSRPPADRTRVNPAVDYPQLDKGGRDAMQHLVIDAQTSWNKDNGATAEGVHASVQAAADSMRYSKKVHGEFAHAVETRIAKEFPNKEKPATKADVDRIIADELLYGKRPTLGGYGPDLGETRWEAEKAQHGEWKPAPADQQTYQPSAGLAPGARAAGAPPPMLAAPGTQQPPYPEALRPKIDAALKKQGNNNPSEDDRIRVWQNLKRVRGAP